MDNNFNNQDNLNKQEQTDYYNNDSYYSNDNYDNNYNTVDRDSSSFPFRIYGCINCAYWANRIINCRHTQYCVLSRSRL